MTRSVEVRRTLHRAQARMSRAVTSLTRASEEVRSLGPTDIWWQGIANDLRTVVEKLDALILTSYERGKKL